MRGPSHRGDFHRADLVNHADLAGTAKRVTIFAQIFLRHRVDARIRTVLSNLRDLTAYSHVPVRVIWIENGNRDAFIAPHVLVLDPVLRGIDPDKRSVEIDPNRRHLRGAVFC